MASVPRAHGCDEAVRTYAQYESVIKHHSVFAQQHGVLQLVDVELTYLIHVQTIEKCPGGCAHDFDLAQGGCIEYPSVLSHAARFCNAGSECIRAMRAIKAGTHPQSHI